MKIPSLPTTLVITNPALVKSQHASSDQNAAVLETRLPQEKDPAPNALASSFTSIKLSRSSSTTGSDGGAGVSIGLLNSMVETSLKMQAIRNDPSIPPDVKKMLLKPLEEANNNSMDIASSDAEQEEKTKILDASNEDAEAIRQAGEEINASIETKSTPEIATADRTASKSGNEDAGGSQETTAGYATQARDGVPAPTPESHSPVYSASPTAAPAGETVDTHA